MIHQFAELGRFYLEREGVKDQLVQYASDPSAKFRSKEVLLLVFSEAGFERVQIEDYEQQRKLDYLYRVGPPNGWDATPTTGMAIVKKGKENTANGEIGKKLTRLARSIREALVEANNLPDWESQALATIRDMLLPPEERLCCHQRLRTDWILGLGDHSAPSDDAEVCSSKGNDCRTPIFTRLREARPDLSKPSILSIAWQPSGGELKRVGHFQCFQQALVRKGVGSASTKKGIKGDVKGTGQCSICGKQNVEVSGLLQVQQFKLYTLDKPGSVSGGFDALQAWRNFPACGECCDRVDFSGERIKRDLTFKYYDFKYLLLPSPLRPIPTEAFNWLSRLVSARVDHKASKRLADTEDELFEVVAAEENRLQVDLLFYEPDPQSFRPALYVAGLLPSRFQKLFKAQALVDSHPWLMAPSAAAFCDGSFTFGSLRNIFPRAHGGSRFDDDFLAATRSALEVRPCRADRFLEIGMRWVQTDYLAGKRWEYRLADLFRCLLFFEVLTLENEGSQQTMLVDYGDTEQAERVRQTFQQAPQASRLRDDASAQAAFLVGACCGRIESIQRELRGSTPFEGKYKGFRLKQPDICQLFVAAKDKAKAYGPEAEIRVSNLLACAAAALSATDAIWPISPDEIAYYFALGHALRSRLAKEKEPETTSTSNEEHNA